MSAHSRLAPIAMMLAASLALSACASKPKDLPPNPGTASTTGPVSGAGGAQVGGPAPGSQADFLAFTQGDDTVYFDTDRFNIDSADAAALQRQAEWLRRYPAARASIEGHCDERGTRDYNLALGERRANAARAFLVSLGVDGSRLVTISYGKERPVALGSNEQAWSQNRRAVTITVQ